VNARNVLIGVYLAGIILAILGSVLSSALIFYIGAATAITAFGAACITTDQTPER
jgi:hypothetical protein